MPNKIAKTVKTYYGYKRLFSFAGMISPPHVLWKIGKKDLISKDPVVISWKKLSILIEIFLGFWGRDASLTALDSRKKRLTPSPKTGNIWKETIWNEKSFLSEDSSKHVLTTKIQAFKEGRKTEYTSRGRKEKATFIREICIFSKIAPNKITKTVKTYYGDRWLLDAQTTVFGVFWSKWHFLVERNRVFCRYTL